MRKTRDQEGQFTPEHTDAEILAAVRAHEPAATSEVASEVGMTRQGADRRLRRLRDEGRVNSKKIGASLVWFAPKQDGEAGQVRRETPPEDSAGGMDVDEPARREGARTPRDEAGIGNGVKEKHTDAEGDLPEAVRTYLKETDTPPKTDHGRSAVVDVFRYLREHGTAKTGELQDAVYPEYAEEWGSARTMWNALDRYLEDVPGVEKAGYGEWGYAGDETVREELGE